MIELDRFTNPSFKYPKFLDAIEQHLWELRKSFPAITGGGLGVSSKDDGSFTIVIHTRPDQARAIAEKLGDKLTIKLDKEEFVFPVEVMGVDWSKMIVPPNKSRSPLKR